MDTILYFLQEGAKTATSGTIPIAECGESTKFIFQVARLVIRILQIAVPFALIIWGSLDFFKAVIAGDEKEMKQKRKPFIQRLIAAVIILVLPILINTIIKTVASDKQSSFKDCWDKSDPTNGIVLPDSTSDDALDY